MAEQIAVGIDIGSNLIKVIVAEESGNKDSKKPKIIGVGICPSKGLRHGFISNPEEVSASLKSAINQAQKSSGYRINKAYLAAGGIGLSGAVYTTSLSMPDKDWTVTEAEIKKIIERCEAELPDSFTLNREIIHSIPLSFKIDGKNVWGKPEGMRGSKLEVRMLFVTMLTHHINSLIETVTGQGIEIEDVIASPLASSLAILSKSQQVAGCVLLNIGAETVSVCIFENGTPISLEVLPIGSSDVTNDIALGLKVSLEEAERVKISRPESVPYPRKKIEEIIGARLSDIFDLVETHLKKAGRSGLLPAGAVITGGGALSPYTEHTAKSILKISAKKAGMKFDGETKYVVKDGVWSPAYGLCMFGIHSSDSDSMSVILGRRVRRVRSNIWSWIKKLLP